MSDNLINDAVRQVIRASGEDITLTTAQRTTTVSQQPSSSTVSGRPFVLICVLVQVLVLAGSGVITYNDQLEEVNKNSM